MGSSGHSSTGRQQRSRSHPTPQRFMTGLALGLILALVMGAFTPLLAQSPSAGTTPKLTAQGLLDDLLNDEDGSVVPAAPIPQDISDHWAADCIDALARRRALPAAADGDRA